VIRGNNEEEKAVELASRSRVEFEGPIAYNEIHEGNGITSTLA
jgi:hypothetical protein